MRGDRAPSTESERRPVVRRLSSRPVYESRWLSLREDRIVHPDGSDGTYSVLDKADLAMVVPFEDDGFHLVEQYRYPVAARSWEFPSGAFPSGMTGTPAELAVAELREETGFTAGELARLGYLNPVSALSALGGHVFLATDLTPGEPNREVTEQDMRQQWFPRVVVETMMRDGVIRESTTIAVYLLFTLHTRPSI